MISRNCDRLNLLPAIFCKEKKSALCLKLWVTDVVYLLPPIVSWVDIVFVAVVCAVHICLAEDGMFVAFL
jgi:hypothetical protein